MDSRWLAATSSRAARVLPRNHVRAPLERPAGAAALCLEYATGGGREAAAGINHLPLESVGAFTERFIRYFDRDSSS